MSVGPSCFILIFTKHLQISETLCFISILSKNYSHFILISIPRAIIINALLKANFQERRVIIHTPNDTKLTFLQSWRSSKTYIGSRYYLKLYILCYNSSHLVNIDS